MAKQSKIGRIDRSPSHKRYNLRNGFDGKGKAKAGKRAGTAIKAKAK